MLPSNGQYGQSSPASVLPVGDFGTAGASSGFASLGAIFTSFRPAIVHICAQTPPSDAAEELDSRRPDIGSANSSNMATSASRAILCWRVGVSIRHGL